MRVFSTRSYAEAGVRDIAAEANANPALVGRYFGSKIELFEAVLDACIGVEWFTQLGRERFGEKIVHEFLDKPRDADNPVPMLILSAGDPTARAAALRYLKTQIMEPLTSWFGELEASERAVQLMTVINGLFIFRMVLPLEPIENPTPAMRRWLAQTLQEIVDR